MTQDLGALEILILLKCNKELLKRSRLSSLYARHPLEKRKKAITQLIMHEYIAETQMPLPNTRNIPTYYKITENGKNWVNNYLSSHPEYKKTKRST